MWPKNQIVECARTNLFTTMMPHDVCLVTVLGLVAVAVAIPGRTAIAEPDHFDPERIHLLEIQRQRETLSEQSFPCTIVLPHLQENPIDRIPGDSDRSDENTTPSSSPGTVSSAGSCPHSIMTPDDIFFYEDTNGTFDSNLQSFMAAAANSFRLANGDNFDFIIFFTDFVAFRGGGVYIGMSNDIGGIGLNRYGRGRLRGLISMFGMEQWGTRPANFDAQTKMVLAHEFDHSVATYLNYMPDGRSFRGEGSSCTGYGCSGCPPNAHWNHRLDAQGGPGTIMRNWVGSGPAIPRAFQFFR